MKGEMLIGLAVVMFGWGVITAIVAPDAYYQANKAESCPDERWDATKSQREVCYAEKQANEVGMTLAEMQ